MYGVDIVDSLDSNYEFPSTLCLFLYLPTLPVHLVDHRSLSFIWRRQNVWDLPNLVRTREADAA